MTNSKNTYYLFKAGRLIGPLTAEKVEALRASREIFQYSWIMDEAHQTWTPVDEMPKENPFQASMKQLKERTLSGAFLHRQNVFEGIIRGIHSFGIELLLPKDNRTHTQLQGESSFLLNLIDETNSKSSNASVVYQGSESTDAGILLRFNWQDLPCPI